MCVCICIFKKTKRDSLDKDMTFSDEPFLFYTS